MAGNVRMARGVRVGSGLRARFHAIEKIPDVEIRRIAPDLRSASGQQLRCTRDDFGVVTRFDPPLVPLEADGA